MRFLKVSSFFLNILTLQRSFPGSLNRQKNQIIVFIRLVFEDMTPEQVSCAVMQDKDFRPWDFENRFEPDAWLQVL